MSADAKRVLLLGLGNTVLTDDGVGIHAVRAAAEEATREGFDTDEAEVAGFALLDLLSGYDAAVVVDAVRVSDAEPGEVVVIDLDSMAPSLHLIAGHQIDLPAALELGRALSLPVPERVLIVGVQIQEDRTFSEECTPEVAAAIPAAAAAALDAARSLR